MTLQKYYIIDNFYPNINYVRELAVASVYELKSSGYNWVGQSTKNKYFLPNFETYLTERLGFLLRKHNPMLNGFFRRSYENDLPKVCAHTDTVTGSNIKIFDSNVTYFTGILYLSLPEYCKDKIGTYLYKHKPTGKMCVENYNDLIVSKKDAHDKNAWEITDSIEMVYNRLLLINADYFHNPGDSFGDNEINCTYKQIFSLVNFR